MALHLADSFADSLARLTAQEQKAAKTTVMDLHLNPSQPGLSFHKLDRAIDKKFWSVRVSADIRLIVHRDGESLLVCHIAHHDDAYGWAERRRIERHPTTGAMQTVEVRERVEEIAPRRIAASPAKPSQPPLFGNLRKVELMAFGVPEDWVDDVREATEDTLFDIIARLPQEAQEALLKLAVGETPTPPAPIEESADPLSHPDAQRRFRLITDLDELEQALNAPWDKWAIYLHPSQRDAVDRNYAGPVRVSGSAGTGKTIVAVHRTASLARRHTDAKVLLTTFSKNLARSLEGKLKRLAASESDVAARVTVAPLSAVAFDLYATQFRQPALPSAGLVQTLIRSALDQGMAKGFSPSFLISEWSDVVDGWQLKTIEDYASVTRLGRKTRLSAKQREQIWPLFQFVRKSMADRKVITKADMLDRLSARIVETGRSPFQFAIVDEAQDLDVAEARFLVALTGGRPNALFLAGDLGQRIFQQPFSLKSLGIDVRGRSTTLKVNYRTSHEIRTGADRLLAGAITDVDGNTESRRGTVSAFSGPPPLVHLAANSEGEISHVASWIGERVAEGCRAEDIGILVRSTAELNRARAAAKAAGLPCDDLGDGREIQPGNLAIGTMHLAKGLEFRAVAVMACDDDILPLQERVEAVADEADLQDVYDTERHLLYVACTRARDHLLVTGVAPGSEFLGDLLSRR